MIFGAAAGENEVCVSGCGNCDCCLIGVAKDASYAPACVTSEPRVEDYELGEQRA